MLGLEPALVEAVLEDWRTAPVDDRMRAALAFIEKLTLHPDQLTDDDIAAARAAGLSNEALHECAYVTFLFSVMDRLADSFDFDIPNAKEIGATGKFLNTFGYRMAKLIR